MPGTREQADLDSVVRLLDSATGVHFESIAPSTDAGRAVIAAVLAPAWAAVPCRAPSWRSFTHQTPDLQVRHPEEFDAWDASRPPLLAVEILSPSNRRTQMERKRQW